MKIYTLKVLFLTILLMFSVFEKQLISQDYVISPDPMVGTTILYSDGAQTSGTADNIDYVEIRSVDDSTIHVRIKWMPSSTGSYTTSNGIHLKSFYHDGSTWRTIYSKIHLPSQFTTGNYYVDEFDYKLPGGSGTVYIRSSLIDRSSSTDTIVGFYACESCGSSSGASRHFDNADVSFSYNPSLMKVENVSVFQDNTLPVLNGSDNQEILKIKVRTSGLLSPIMLNSLTFNINGTSVASDISGAKVFYTGSDSIFSTNSQYGSTYFNPTGSFSITGSTELGEGNHYFWLAYDISENSTSGNIIDAEFIQLEAGSIIYKPLDSAPVGNRTVFVETVLPPGTGNSITTCSTKFYDNGGSTGSYTNNFNGSMTFYPATPGSKIKISFNSFLTESCCDNLFIYNGNSSTAPLVGTYKGNTLPPVITSSASDGSLTIEFDSDASVNSAGWEADISCHTPTPMSYNNCNIVQNTENIYAGASDENVLKLAVDMTGSINPLSATSFSFTTNGTTNTSDLTNAKLF
ncbi:MAG: BNR-repeat neuraminidase N-terminal domain-containing protein, partial [bacterium]